MQKFNDLSRLVTRSIKTPLDVLIHVVVIVVALSCFGLFGYLLLERTSSEACVKMDFVGVVCRNHGWIILISVLGSMASQFALLVNGLRLRNPGAGEGTMSRETTDSN